MIKNGKNIPPEKRQQYIDELAEKIERWRANGCPDPAIISKAYNIAIPNENPEDSLHGKEN